MTETNENTRTGRIGSSASNLNPSMSRGGFVKTVGVAGAAMGIGAAGFAGAAKAQTPPPSPRTFTIYPVEHSMFEKKFTPTQGQTQFALEVAGPFTFCQAQLLVGEEFIATEGQPGFILTRPADPWGLTAMEVNGVRNNDITVDGQTVTVGSSITLQAGDVVLFTSTYYLGFPFVEGIDPKNFTISGKTFTWNPATTGYTLTPKDTLIVQAIFAPEKFTATPGQKVFPSGSGAELAYASKNAGFASVLINGVQKTSGYTIAPVGGKWKLTFANGLANNDKVVVVYGDFDLLSETVATAADGDRIELSDTNLAGMQKKWFYSRPAGPRVPVYVITPTGSYDWTNPDVGNWTAYKSLAITKGITFCKKPTGGKPTFCHYLPGDTWDIAWKWIDFGTPYAFPIISGNVFASPAKRPRFEDINFERAYVGIVAFSPFVFDRCGFDYHSECIMPGIDNRMTFPHLTETNIDFSDMLTTEITNCTFSHLNWAPINAQLSGLVFAHNKVSDYMGTVSIVQINGSGSTSQGTFFWGLPENANMSRYGCFNQVLDNDIDGANAPYGCLWVVLSGEAVSGGEAFNNSIKNNRFSDWTAMQVAEAGWAYDGGVSHDNEICGNTFIRCAGSAVVDSTTSDGLLEEKVSNALISGNTFIDCDKAASLLWQNADGTPAQGGPAVLLRNTSDCTVSGNNYVRSGLVSASKAVNDNDVPILLIRSDHCAVNESKGSFPNSGVPQEWVIDIDGTENTINTRDRTLYRGKSLRGNVPQRKLLRQHTKLHEYHNSYRF